jgi:hypothetical protein
MTNEKCDMENGFLLLAAVCSLQRGQARLPNLQISEA